MDFHFKTKNDLLCDQSFSFLVIGNPCFVFVLFCFPNKVKLWSEVVMDKYLLLNRWASVTLTNSFRDQSATGFLSQTNIWTSFRLTVHDFFFFYCFTRTVISLLQMRK